MRRALLCSLIGASMLAGCASTEPGQQGSSYKNTGIGAGVGAVAGGLLGAVLDKHHRGTGALIGAAGGAALGGGTGYLFDRQQKAFDDSLAAEQRQNQVQIQRVRDDLLKITLQNQVLFDFDKASVKPAMEPTLTKLASVLVKYDQSDATVVGYTDSVGSEAYNKQLSLRRAQAVVDFLVAQGVPAQRLRAEGMGEANPVASNATDAGRQLNRRVEILVSPSSSPQPQPQPQQPRQAPAPTT
jgi:outer membrane protein OmpA-like peptidoglycan-associated protein